MKRIILSILLVFVSITSSFAQLTAAQKVVFAAAVTANQTWNGVTHNTDGAYALADMMNATASPGFTVWKTMESLQDIGDAFNSSELGTRSTADSTRLQVIGQYHPNGINPSISTNRAFFDDIFSGSGGANTRASLLSLWKRFATVGEKILATGTGSDASPATLGFSGTLTPQDILQAMGW